MALPASNGSSDRREDIARLLAESPDGLSDSALAAALGGVRPQTVNQLCRRMVTEGRLERVGTRPIRNRLVGAVIDDRDDRPQEAPGARDDHAEDGALALPRAPSLAAPVDDGPTSAPVYDRLQAWSRAVNVQASVADWLARRGATIRSASADGRGPACDLVASLDGDDVHVEITGWPPDGARTHPITVAGDWFSAAEHAAAERRRAHPQARIVIALPDTRRYRSLTRDRAAALDVTQAEVWFVDPTGAVHAGVRVPVG